MQRIKHRVTKPQRKFIVYEWIKTLYLCGSVFETYFDAALFSYKLIFIPSFASVVSGKIFTASCLSGNGSS